MILPIPSHPMLVFVTDARYRVDLIYFLCNNVDKRDIVIDYLHEYLRLCFTSLLRQKGTLNCLSSQADSVTRRHDQGMSRYLPFPHIRKLFPSFPGRYTMKCTSTVPISGPGNKYLGSRAILWYGVGGMKDSSCHKSHAYIPGSRVMLCTVQVLVIRSQDGNL